MSSIFHGYGLLSVAFFSCVLQQMPALEFVDGTTQRKVYDYTSETVPFVFPFRNETDQVLRIDEVESTCSCVIEDSVARDYVPGEEGVISIAMKARHIVGTARRRVLVKYRLGAGAVQEEALRLELRVPRAVEARQSVVVFRVEGDEPVAGVEELDLYQNPRLPCRVLGLDASTAPSYSVRLMTADGTEWKDPETDGFPVSVQVRSKSGAVGKGEYFMIRTDFPHKAAQQVKFRIVVFRRDVPDESE